MESPTSLLTANLSVHVRSWDVGKRPRGHAPESGHKRMTGQGFFRCERFRSRCFVSCSKEFGFYEGLVLLCFVDFWDGTANFGKRFA